MSKYGVISGPYFPVFSLNTVKYGPEITPYFDTFRAVIGKRYLGNLLMTPWAVKFWKFSRMPENNIADLLFLPYYSRMRKNFLQWKGNNVRAICWHNTSFLELVAWHTELNATPNNLFMKNPSDALKIA